MVSLKKYVPCKCGANNSFDFSSDMHVDDITFSARCPSCGASVAVCISSLLSSQQQPGQAKAPESPALAAAEEMAQAGADAKTSENVEQAVRDLFRY